MAEQKPHDVANHCRAVASHLEQLASRVPADARELFEDTARLLRARAAQSQQTARTAATEAMPHGSDAPVRHATNKAEHGVARPGPTLTVASSVDDHR
jgi:hypothetical protein